MSKKVVLIDPTPTQKDKDILVRNTADFTTGSPVAVREPIAIQSIGGYIKQSGYEPVILAEGNNNMEELAARACAGDPAAVGISLHSTYLYGHGLELAREIKRIKPDLTVITGGYHASGDWDIVKNDCIDFIVRGEGEETFKELLDHLHDDKKWPEIKGIVYSKDGNAVVTAPRERADFSRLPWALRDAGVLEHNRCAPLCYPPPPGQTSAAQISYSRGCPHGCDFCASPLIWGSRVSYRNPGDVTAEIKYLQNEFNTNFLFFNDLSFNADKKRALALTREIKSAALDVHWFAYANIHNFDEEIARAMKDAGCSRLGFGVESVHDPTLAKIKPAQRFDKIQAVLEMTGDLGMLNRCYMMIGWPWETRETLEQTGEIMKLLPMDQVRLAFFIPFPGTVSYRRYREKIVKGFADFTGDTPVMPTDNVSVEELQELAQKLAAAYYNSTGYRRMVERKTRKFPHLKKSFDYFLDYLQRHGILQD
jgi:radical SAM superfamily enzyme YgiQ (UPF0313 family)